MSDKLTGLDTNIFVFADDPLSPHHNQAKSILENALKGALRACISPQILAEYFAVITSKRQVQHPLTVEEAKNRVLFINKIRRIKKVYPKRSTLKKSIALCAQHGLQGAHIFDAFYATTLLDNNVHKLITQNRKDFLAFKDMETENPF